MGNDLARVGTRSRGGSGRGRDCPDASGAGCFSGYRGRVALPSVPWLAGRDVWGSGTDGGRARRGGRGIGAGEQNRGAFTRGGAVSAERRIVSAVQASQGHRSRQVQRHQHPDRSRSVFSESDRGCPTATGEVVGVTGSDEPEPTVAEPG